MAATKKSTTKPAAKTKTVAKKSAPKIATKTAKKAAPKVDLEARLAAQTPETAERNPNQPVAVLGATATRSAELATPLITTLAKLPGFEVRWVTELPTYVEALNTSEIRWNEGRAGTRAGVSPAMVTEAEGLKSETFSSARYLLRKNPEEQQVLDQISQGTGVADLTQDLRELAAMVDRHPEAFAADTTFPADAAPTMRALAAKLDKGITPAEAAEAQARRNRLFWLVDEANDEIRAALKHVWRKHPTKLAVLGVSYVTQRVRKFRKAQKEAKEKAAPTPK